MVSYDNIFCDFMIYEIADEMDVDTLYMFRTNVPKEYFKSGNKIDYHKHQEWFKNRENRLDLLVRNCERIVGWLMFSKMNTDLPEIGIIIEECYRNRGYGTNIIKNAVSILKTLGYKRCFAICFYHNLGVISIFTKNFFIVVNSKSSKDWLHMERGLC